MREILCKGVHLRIYPSRLVIGSDELQVIGDARDAPARKALVTIFVVARLVVLCRQVGRVERVHKLESFALRNIRPQRPVDGNGSRTKGGRWQSGFVHEIGQGAMVPRETDGYRHGDALSRQHHARPIDRRGCLTVCAVRTANLKPGGRGAIPCAQRLRMLEIDPHGVPLDLKPVEEWAFADDIRFPIGLVEGLQREALAHIVLVGRVDVRQIADIVDDGHSGARDLRCGRLGFPDFGQGLGAVAIVVGRQLHEVTCEIVLLPHSAPSLDERFHLVAVQHALAPVRFALVPDETPVGIGHERRDHRIVECCRRSLINQSRCRRDGGQRGRKYAVLKSQLGFRNPRFHLGDRFRQQLLVLGAVGLVYPNLRDYAGQRRYRLETRGGSPRFDPGPAPTRVDDSYGHAQTRLKMLGEVVTHSRKPFAVAAVRQ